MMVSSLMACMVSPRPALLQFQRPCGGNPQVMARFCRVLQSLVFHRVYLLSGALVNDLKDVILGHPAAVLAVEQRQVSGPAAPGL